MTRREKITELLKTYDRSQQDKINEKVKLQHRLQALVHEFGIDDTALAAGIRPSTLVNYIRARVPVSVSEKTVEQAENILSQVR